MTGAQFLTKRENVDKIDINNTLAAVAIAYIPHTTTDSIIRYIYPLANWQAVSDRSEAVAKLQRGEVNAVVSDGILLLGELVKQGQDPRQFVLLPSQPITTELYGCILPDNALSSLLLGNLGFLRFFENNDLIILSRLADELQARFTRKY